MKHKPLFIILLTLAAAVCLSAFALAAEAEPVAAEPAAETEAVSVPLSEQFTDLSYSENEAALSFMIDRGFIAGYTDGTFRPGRSYTRLELAQLVTALCELETASGWKSSFYDCSVAGSEAIDAAVSNGLMTGRSIQSFDPYGSVLKAEMIGTLEKAAACLQLDGFYDHASGSYTDWATDYTICTADDAMGCAYQLAQAMELKAEAEAQAAATQAAANAVAELTGEAIAQPSEEMSSYDKMTASNEPDTPAEPATDTEEAQTEAEDADNAEDAAESEPVSGEPSGEPSGEASAEPTEASAPSVPAQPQEEESTPPAGVTTPASTAAAPTENTQPAQSVPAAAPSVAVAEEESEADGLRNEIKDKYYEIRDSIVSFLRDLLGA